MARRLDERLASLRCAKALAAQRLWTLDSLAELTEAEVLDIKGVGPAALRQIREALWDCGLELSPSSPQPPRAGDAGDGGDSEGVDAPGPVELATLARVAALAEHVKRLPHAAIAVRLARELDDLGMAATAKELRATLLDLDALSPPAVTLDRVDQVAAQRSRRRRRKVGS